MRSALAELAKRSARRCTYGWGVAIGGYYILYTDAVDCRQPGTITSSIRGDCLKPVTNGLYEKTSCCVPKSRGERGYDGVAYLRDTDARPYAPGNHRTIFISTLLNWSATAATCLMSPSGCDCRWTRCGQGNLQAKANGLVDELR